MYTILICDDETIERNYLKSILKKYPKKYQLIGEAANGQQAIDISLAYKPNIIIMDINMPLYNGLEAANFIKAKNKNTIIVLNSAYAEFEFARQAIEYNLDAYLLKPASEKDILETIDTCVQRKELKGQVCGDYKSSSQKFANKYPYTIIDQLIKAISTHDLKLIEHNINTYLDFLKLQQNHLEEYRLHIINTIFSIMRTFYSTVPENNQIMTKCDIFIQDISKVKYWYEMLALTENYFNQLLFQLKQNSIFNQDCTELIKTYIDKYFQERITLDNLSELFHFHPSYISRVFHENKGITIKSYINKKRIDYAIYLLETSDLAIKDIAHSSGFVNTSHFNRVFKKLTDDVPSQIKRKDKKHNENRA